MKTKYSLDARSLDHNVLELLRKRAVIAVEHGWPVKDVAAVLGINRRTVFRWLSEYRCGGMDALIAKPIPGRPKRKL